MKNYAVLPQVLVAIAANGGSLLYGITLGWSAPTGPKILSPENKFPVTENELSWAVAMMPLGGALFCVVSGIVRDRFGTKLTMLFFSVPNLIGWLLISFAGNPLMLILGRFFSGIAGGAICFNIPIYVGEIASKEVRGFLLTLYQVFVKIGVVFVYTLGSLVDLFTLNIVCTLLLLVYTTYFMFLPESPVMLIRQNKTEEAEKSIKLLRGSTFNAQPEIMEFKRVFDEASKAPKNSFFNEIRKRETWRALVFILCIFFFFHMSGINAVIVYSTLIFIETGITMEPSTATIILGIVQVIATLSASMLVDRFGRKFLLAISFVMMIVGLVGIGSFFCLKDANIFETKAIDWIPLPSLCIFVIGFSSGLGPVPFVLLGEIFSTDAKRVIAPFAQTMSFAMSFIIGLIFPSLVSLIGAGFTFFMFATFCFLGLLFTIFILPETKGKSLIEIQMLLRS